MTQFIFPHKLKAESLKHKAASKKKKAKSSKPHALSYYIKAFGFQLSAFSVLLASFGTRIGLLWRRSVQLRFSMASSFLRSFHAFFGWQMANGRWQVKKGFWLSFFGFRRQVSCFRLSACSFLLLACSFSFAQKPPTVDTSYSSTDTANIYYNDSTKIDDNEVVDTARAAVDQKITAAIIFLSEDSVNVLRRSKGFEYMAYIDSLLKAKEIEKKKKPAKTEQPESGTSFWDLSFIVALCWIVAIGVVVFVLYRLFLGQGSAFSSNAKNNIPQVDMEEEADLDDLDGQLKKAIQNGNYRLATRYLFLKTLQHLADKNAISLSTEKTNIQYSQELRGKPYADSFARLCLLYEYVWFGEFNINEEQFASIQQQQQQLEKAIQ